MTAQEKALANIARDRARVETLLKDPANLYNRVELINILIAALSHHTTGKIAGIVSLDVAAKECEQCQRFRAAAVSDPRIICGLCYAHNEHAIPQARHAITGLILSTMELTEEEAARIYINSELIRFNSDGELLNKTHAVNLIRITSAMHQWQRPALWTKRPGTLAEAVRQEGRPEKLSIGISSLMINTPYQPTPEIMETLRPDFIFTVYTPGRITAALAQPGTRQCNGKSCRQCGFKCYTERPADRKPIHVVELLRRPYNMTKADFNALCERIDART